MAGPGAGYYFLKNDDRTFSIEIGTSYIGEKHGASASAASDENDAVALRLTQRLDHKIGTAAKMWELSEYLPEFEELDNYLLRVEAGIETAITERLRLRVVIQDTYDSSPATGVKNNDLVVKSALVCTL